MTGVLEDEGNRELAVKPLIPDSFPLRGKLLETDIKPVANYAERRIICITPNEAKRLGAKQ